MSIKSIELTDIHIPSKRLRAIDEAKVKELAASIERSGLLQPIVVVPSFAADFSPGYILIAGKHRYKAVKKLGLTKIQCNILYGLDADAAILAEIDENLIRAELTDAERAMHIAKRKEIYERVHPETKVGKGAGKPKKSDRTASFARATAKATGKSKRTIERDAKRGKKVKVLGDIVGTSLDSGTELDALAELPVVEQEQLAEQAKAGKKVTAVKKAKRVSKEAEAEPARTLEADDDARAVHKLSIARAAYVDALAYLAHQELKEEILYLLATLGFPSPEIYVSPELAA